MPLIGLCFWFAQEIAEMCESEQNIEKALVYFEKSADFYESEEVTTSANQCKQKVAQFSAQLEQYDFLFSTYFIFFITENASIIMIEQGFLSFYAGCLPCFFLVKHADFPKFHLVLY